MAKSPLLILRIHVILWTSMIMYVQIMYVQIMCVQIPRAVRMRNAALAKEHLNGFERCGRLVHLSLYF